MTSLVPNTPTDGIANPMLSVPELQKLRNTIDAMQKTETNPETQVALKLRVNDLKRREALQTCPICQYFTLELKQPIEHDDTHQKYVNAQK